MNIEIRGRLPKHAKIPAMKEFVSDREALDYVSTRIAAEAEREGMPLSEVERKMLYFSGTDWTLPDMAAVSAEFDRDYDENEYERKISGLVRKIESHDEKHDQEELQAWNAAIAKLCEGDRYLLVLLDPPLSEPRTGRPPHDILKLWLTAFGIVFGILGLALLNTRLLGTKLGAAADWVFEDRDRSGVIVVIMVVLGAYFGPKFKDWFRDFQRRRRGGL
jgi:hypothetical protein